MPGLGVASKFAKVFNVSLYIFWIRQAKLKRNIDMNVADDHRKIRHEFAESLGLDVLNLSPRSYNALYRAEIETVDELLLLSEKELSKIRRLGPQANGR